MDTHSLAADFVYYVSLRVDFVLPARIFGRYSIRAY